MFFLAFALRKCRDWEKVYAIEANAMAYLDITGHIIQCDGLIGRGAYGSVFTAKWLRSEPMRWDPEPRTHQVGLTHYIPSGR